MEAFTQRNFVADRHLSTEVEFYCRFVPPFGRLRDNVHGSSIWLVAVGKRVVDFLLVLIKHFR